MSKTYILIDYKRSKNTVCGVYDRLPSDKDVSEILSARGYDPDRFSKNLKRVVHDTDVKHVFMFANGEPSLIWLDEYQTNSTVQW